MKKAVLYILLTLTTVLVCSTSTKLKTSANSHPGALQARRVEIGGATISVNFEPGRLNLSEEDVLDWIRWSGRAVSAFYGRFPLRHLNVNIRPRGGRGVHY